VNLARVIAHVHITFSLRCGGQNRQTLARVKYWEIIADNLKKAGWSLGRVSAVDREGRTIWIVDAHGYGKRFIVRADEMLTAFVELQRAIHDFAVDLIA
jgi:hypothetical protein